MEVAGLSVAACGTLACLALLAVMIVVVLRAADESAEHRMRALVQADTQGRDDAAAGQG